MQPASAFDNIDAFGNVRYMRYRDTKAEPPVITIDQCVKPLNAISNKPYPIPPIINKNIHFSETFTLSPEILFSEIIIIFWGIYHYYTF